MISLFKRKTKPLVNNTGFNFEDIKSMLSTSQTWGTDRKVFDIFIDNLKSQTPVLKYQEIIQKLPKKLSKLAYYYLVSQYWHFYSLTYTYEKYEESFFYFLDINKIKRSMIYHPRISKLAYFYLNKIKFIN